MTLDAVSDPLLAPQADGSRAIRIVSILKRTEPHVANLKDDYQKISEVALVQKQNETVTRWINRHIPGTYLRIEDEFKSCKFDHDWTVAEPVEN